VRTLAAVLVVLGGCVEPTQYQGLIPVDHRGLARRLDALCRAGAGDDVTQQACAEEREGEPPAPARGGRGGAPRTAR
jgi:hypothetical protein